MAVEAYLGNPPANIVDWIKAHTQPPATPSPYFTYDSNRVITGLYQGSPNVYEEGTYTDYNEWDEETQSNPQVPYSGWTYGGSDVVENYATTIGESAFYNNFYAMMNIPPSKGITGNITFQNVTSIQTTAFEYCAQLTNVTMPNVMSIMYSAFQCCTNLTSITIGNGIQEIGSSAFDTQGNPITLTIGKTVAEVQTMGQTGYDAETNVTCFEWGLPSGSTIVCTDGTIPIT